MNGDELRHPTGHLFYRHRFRNTVALRYVATEAHQQHALLNRFHSFSNNLAVKDGLK